MDCGEMILSSEDIASGMCEERDWYMCEFRLPAFLLFELFLVA